MRKFKITIFSILLLVLFKVESLVAKEVNQEEENNKDSICLANADERIKSIDIDDREFIVDFKEGIRSVVEANKKTLFKDLAKDDGFNENFVKFNQEIENKLISEIKLIQKNRKETLYSEYKKVDSLQAELFKHKKPNYQLIIIIIVSAGLIGGIAKTNWSFLPEVGEELKKIKEQLDECKKRIPNPPTPTELNEKDKGVFLNSIKNITANIDLKMLSVESTLNNIQSNVDNAIKDSRAMFNTYFASIIFGIIASSLAVLALNIINSKILEFSKTTDYLVLWGWCILGAIYAKRWIEDLYGKLATIIKE